MAGPLPKVIYVMGAPGAGKGTQAQMLAKKIGYVQFSTGDEFRRLRTQDTPLGREVKERYDKGLLQTPELAAKVVIAAVKKYVEQGQGLVFDGTPRTVKESETVDAFFKEHNLGRPLAIFLSVDRDETIERNLKRRYCLKVPQMFPVMTAEDEQKCIEQGGEVGKRSDDSAEQMKVRWDETMNQTFPVVEKYKNEGILHEINGLGTIEEVHAAVMDVIAQYQ